MSKIKAAFVALAVIAALVPLGPAQASPVCTDGYMGGPPLAACGDRIFPEAAVARSYVQYLPDPAGFREYQHGLEFLEEKYPRWIDVFSFSQHFKTDKAVTAGEDNIRPYENDDTEDGHDIWVIRITDHNVPDKGKETLFFSLSVHGNERGGLEGGLRAAEDLAIAADDTGENPERLVDGIDNYETTTGTDPVFHEYNVREVLKREVVYLVDFNIDGWSIGDQYHQPPLPYERGNSLGTDLNRQMPTIGRINEGRNPLQESEMFYGHKLMHEVAAAGINDLMAYGADVHGELTSNAYVDIMYPAGQFDSIDHRRLMAIAERTKSVIDATLYEGIIDQIENPSGGNDGDPANPVPSKPAAWGTVWDTLGYTDTGFIGDYLATDLGVTGMDYEIFLNHSVPDKNWNVYLQENHINATRAIVKTAMAYALYQSEEFNKKNVGVNTQGQAGYVFRAKRVRNDDGNGPGVQPGPQKDGIGADGKKVKQRPYSVSNMEWFKDTNKIMPRPFKKVLPLEVVKTKVLNQLDTLVLADTTKPRMPNGCSCTKKKPYWAAIKSWVRKGGNLVLTDRGLHALGRLGVVPKEAVTNTKVYQPYADFVDLEHPMVAGLRPNARQLVEAAILGYCIGVTCSPMSVVEEAAFTAAEGHIVGTTGDGQVSVGQIPFGDGQIRILGGALPRPTEKYDHRYGLRDYAMTYSGLYIMENSVVYNAPGLGARRATAKAL